MLMTIKAVARGEALFGPSIAARLMEFMSAVSRKEEKLFPELTKRERQVLELIAQGLDNAEIANQLTISIKTVSNHVSNILNKMQVTDRVQAVIRARDAGMGRKK
jgi:DNA-binding NarL/FixJ family response regulator